LLLSSGTHILRGSTGIVGANGHKEARKRRRSGKTRIHYGSDSGRGLLKPDYQKGQIQAPEEGKEGADKEVPQYTL